MSASSTPTAIRSSSPSGNPWCHVINTENIDNPFDNVEVGEKVIVGGRALKLMTGHFSKGEQGRPPSVS